MAIVSLVPCLVIVNPQSRRGRTGLAWRSLEARVRSVLGRIEVVATTGRRVATVLAREAAERGVETIIAAGGDGTVSEVAAGVLDSGRADDVALGLLPLGSGGDLARALGIGRSLDFALKVLAARRIRRIDVGRVRCVDLSGQYWQGWFVNEASVGLSADVAQQVERMTQRFGGTAAFALGAARTIVEHCAAQTCVRVDDKRVHDGGTTLVAISNGPCFGGGMQVAPNAELDDGLLDVVMAPAFSRGKLLADLFPRIYRGAHLSDPRIDVHRGQRVEIEPLGDAEPAAVEADGELLGTLPARFEIVADALRLIAPVGS